MPNWRVLEFVSGAPGTKIASSSQDRRYSGYLLYTFQKRNDIIKDGVFYAKYTTKGGLPMSKQELLQKYNDMLDKIEFMARQEDEDTLEFAKIIYSMLDDFKAEIEKLQ